MGDGSKILLLLAVLAGAALVFFLHSETPWNSTQDSSVPPPLQRPAEPARDNVSHDFRIRADSLRRHLEHAPGDTLSLLRLAILLQDAHQPADAAAYYRKYLDLRPANRQAWLDLSNCYAEAEQWANALDVATSFLEQFPNDPSGLYNMGAVQANLGDFAEARRWWEMARDQTTDPQVASFATSSLTRIKYVRQ